MRILTCVLFALYCPLAFSIVPSDDWKLVNAFTYGNYFYTPAQFDNDLAIFVQGGAESVVSFQMATSRSRPPTLQSVNLSAAVARAVSSWNSAIFAYNQNRLRDSQVPARIRIVMTPTIADADVSLANSRQQRFVREFVYGDSLALAVPIVPPAVFAESEFVPEFPVPGVYVSGVISIDFPQATMLSRYFGFSSITNLSGADRQYIADTYVQALLMHEIGHLLGLAHPDDYDGPQGSAAAAPPVADNGREGVEREIDTVLRSRTASSLPPIMASDMANYLGSLFDSVRGSGGSRITQEALTPSSLELEAIVELDNCGVVLDDADASRSLGASGIVLARSAECTISSRNSAKRNMVNTMLIYGGTRFFGSGGTGAR